MGWKEEMQTRADSLSLGANLPSANLPSANLLSANLPSANLPDANHARFAPLAGFRNRPLSEKPSDFRGLQKLVVAGVQTANRCKPQFMR